MSEWKTYKLRDVVNILDYKRIPLSSRQREQRRGKYPYYGAQGIIDYIDDYIFDGTYLLVAEDGENLRSKKQHIAQLVSGKYWVNNHAHILESNGLCDIRYICYLLNVFDISGYITGSAQPKLNQANLLAIEISLPPLAEQKRIADILSAIDDKIELDRRINTNLEQQAQALYKSWFVDFEPFGGKMPEDWREGTLGDICTELKEKVHERDDVKVLSPVVTGQLMLSEEFFTKQVYSKSIVKYIVVPQNCFAYNPARVNIGSLGMNEFDFDGCVSPVYVVFRCQNGYEYFFDLFRQTKPFKDEVKLRAIGGVRQTLSYDDFARIQVNIPTYNVVQDFNKIYLTNLDVRWHNQYEILRLAQLRDTLLPKLMSGEITI